MRRIHLAPGILNLLAQHAPFLRGHSVVTRILIAFRRSSVLLVLILAGIDSILALRLLPFPLSATVIPVAPPRPGIDIRHAGHEHDQCADYGEKLFHHLLRSAGIYNIHAADNQYECMVCRFTYTDKPIFVKFVTVCNGQADRCFLPEL